MGKYILINHPSPPLEEEHKGPTTKMLQHRRDSSTSSEYDPHYGGQVTASHIGEHFNYTR